MVHPYVSQQRCDHDRRGKWYHHCFEMYYFYNDLLPPSERPQMAQVDDVEAFQTCSCHDAV